MSRVRNAFVQAGGIAGAALGTLVGATVVAYTFDEIATVTKPWWSKVFGKTDINLPNNGQQHGGQKQFGPPGGGGQYNGGHHQHYNGRDYGFKPTHPSERYSGDLRSRFGG